MIYVSCDVETTGVDPQVHSLLEVGMAVFDTNKTDEPTHTFNYLIEKHNRMWSDDTFKFHMKNGKLEYFMTANPRIHEADLALHMSDFLAKIQKVLDFEWYVPTRKKPPVLGKNFAGFDMGFLKRVSGWHDMFDFRVMDLGNMAMRRDDIRLPNTSESLKRLGQGDFVPHTALEDAILIGKAAHRWFNNDPRMA